MDEQQPINWDEVVAYTQTNPEAATAVWGKLTEPERVQFLEAHKRWATGRVENRPDTAIADVGDFSVDFEDLVGVGALAKGGAALARKVASAPGEVVNLAKRAGPIALDLGMMLKGGPFGAMFAGRRALRGITEAIGGGAKTAAKTAGSVADDVSPAAFRTGTGTAGPHIPPAPKSDLPASTYRSSTWPRAQATVKADPKPGVQMRSPMPGNVERIRSVTDIEAMARKLGVSEKEIRQIYHMAGNAQSKGVKVAGDDVITHTKKAAVKRRTPK